jgi:acyl dehydratase
VTAYRAAKGIVTLRTTCANQSGDPVIDGEAVLLVLDPATP